MNIKKIIALSTIIAVVVTQSMTGIVSAVDQTAVNTEWENSVSFMKENGLSSTADSVEQYEPLAEVKREAAAKLFVNFAKIKFGMEPDATKTDCIFTDIDDAQEWAKSFIIEACQMGILKGADGKFMPKDNLTKLQFLTVLARIVKNDSSIEPEDAFNVLKEEGITKEDNLADTVRPVSRIELSMLFQRSSDKYSSTSTGDTTDTGDDSDISNILGALLGDDSTTTGDDSTTTGDDSTTTGDDSTTTGDDTTTTGDDTTTTVAGDLEVSLSPTTPAATTIPQGAGAVKVASYDFTAGSSDVTVNSVLLTRAGLGDSDDYDKVYLYVDGKKLTTGKSFSTSTNTLTFTNLNLIVKAGSTQKVDVVVDVDTATAASNNSNIVSIVAATDISSSAATVAGSFPISANTMTIGGVSVGKGDVESAGTDYTRKVGEKEVEVSTFSVHVNNTEDAELKSITLYNGGKDVYENLKLYRGSDKVADGVVNGDYVTFALSTPYAIAKGNSANFTVKSDIIGTKDDVGQLQVRYKVDVELVGKTYGYPLAMDVTEGSAAADSYIDELDATLNTTNTTVEAGKITITFNGPVASDVSKDTNDVALMNFSVTSQSDVTVEKVGFILKDSDNADDDDVTNMELVCGGTVMNEWSDPTESAAGTAHTDTSTWDLKAGETKNCIVRADIENAKTANDTVSVTLDVSNWTFKDANNDSVTDIIPSADIVGNNMTVKAASLTVTQSSSPTSQTFVKGYAGADLMAFDFKAGDASDVKITNLKLNAFLDENNDTTYNVAVDNSIYAKDVVGTVYLYDGSTLLGTETITTAGLVEFDSLNLTVTKGATKKLTLKGDFSTSAYYNANVDKVKFDVNAVTSEYGSAGTSLIADISAVDTEGEITVFQTVDNSGTFTVSPLTVPGGSKNQVVQAGTTGEEVARYELKSSKEKFNVNKLTFDFVGSPEIVKSMTLKIGTGEKTEYSINGNEVTFSNIGVQVNGTVQASLFVDFNSMDVSGNDTGKSAKFTLADDNDPTETEVVGVGSSTKINDLADVDDSSVNKTCYVRNSKLTFDKPTSGLVADLDTASSDAILYLATVTNSNGGSVDLGKLTFNFDITEAVAAPGNFVSDIKLYINGYEVSPSDATYSATSLDADGNVTITLNSNYKGLISSGSTIELKLTADVASVDGNALSVDLLDDDTNNFVLTAKKTLGNIVNGQVDVDGDGTTASDVDDDLAFVVLNGTSYAVINGQVDVDGDGTTASDADDDLASVSINGAIYNIVNGEFDIDGDGTTASDVGDNLIVTRNFVWSDKANPDHKDTTADWANGYGLNMNVLSNNVFSNK